MNPSDSLEFLEEMPDSTRRANLSVREAAQILELSPQRVGFYIRRGDLPATSFNGLDYVLKRKDVLSFDHQRRTGKRQTEPGRPGPKQLEKQQAERARAARRREELRQKLNRPASPARE